MNNKNIIFGGANQENLCVNINQSKDIALVKNGLTINGLIINLSKIN